MNSIRFTPPSSALQTCGRDAGHAFSRPGVAQTLTILASLLAVWLCLPSAQALGAVRIEPIAAYNLVVDSNVESPSTYAPRAAYLGATFHNDGAVALTNVFAYIGNFTNFTPGIYPRRAHG